MKKVLTTLLFVQVIAYTFASEPMTQEKVVLTGNIEKYVAIATGDIAIDMGKPTTDNGTRGFNTERSVRVRIDCNTGIKLDVQLFAMRHKLNHQPLTTQASFVLDGSEDSETSLMTADVNPSTPAIFLIQPVVPGTYWGTLYGRVRRRGLADPAGDYEGRLEYTVTPL